MLLHLPKLPKWPLLSSLVGGIVVMLFWSSPLDGWGTGKVGAASDQELPPSKSLRTMGKKEDRGESEDLTSETRKRIAAANAQKAPQKKVVTLADGSLVDLGEEGRIGPSAVAKQVSARDSAKAQLRARLLEKAGKLAIHSEEPSKSLVQVALSYHRTGNLEAMQIWFERAIRLAVDPDDANKTSLALREVVQGMVSVGETAQALELIHRIPVSRYRELSVAGIVRKLASRREFDQAVSLAGRLAESGARARAFRGVAEAQARFDLLDDSSLTVQLIPPGKERDEAWMQVALVRARAGDGGNAFRLIERIRDERVRDLALVRLAEQASRSRGVGSPETILSLLHDPFLRDRSLLQLVEQRVARLQFSKAEAVAARIQSQEDHAVAMELLVSLQVQQGDFRGALSRARGIAVASSRNHALQTIALRQVTVQGPPAARYTVDLIHERKDRDAAYRKIAERTASLGIHHQIEPSIGAIESASERASAYATAARLQARRGSLVPARHLIEEAEHEVESIPYGKNQWRALSMLATAHAETGDEATALSVAADIEDAGLRDRTYQQLSRKFAGNSEIELAEESAQAIERDSVRERALDEVARVVAGRTRATEALGRLRMFEARRQQVKFLLEVARRI